MKQHVCCGRHALDAHHCRWTRWRPLQHPIFLEMYVSPTNSPRLTESSDRVLEHLIRPQGKRQEAGAVDCIRATSRFHIIILLINMIHLNAILWTRIDRETPVARVDNGANVGSTLPGGVVRLDMCITLMSCKSMVVRPGGGGHRLAEERITGREQLYT